MHMQLPFFFWLAHRLLIHSFTHSHIVYSFVLCSVTAFWWPGGSRALWLGACRLVRFALFARSASRGCLVRSPKQTNTSLVHSFDQHLSLILLLFIHLGHSLTQSFIFPHIRSIHSFTHLHTVRIRYSSTCSFTHSLIHTIHSIITAVLLLTVVTGDSTIPPQRIVQINISLFSVFNFAYCRDVSRDFHWSFSSRDYWKDWSVTVSLRNMKFSQFRSWHAKSDLW
jgi:hypothetical protein